MPCGLNTVSKHTFTLQKNSAMDILYITKALIHIKNDLVSGINDRLLLNSGANSLKNILELLCVFIHVLESQQDFLFPFFPISWLHSVAVDYYLPILSADEGKYQHQQSRWKAA